MDLIKAFLDVVLHLQDHLYRLTSDHGAWVYGILFLIIFAETGLVLTPVLPVIRCSSPWARWRPIRPRVSMSGWPGP